MCEQGLDFRNVRVEYDLIAVSADSVMSLTLSANSGSTWLAANYYDLLLGYGNTSAWVTTSANAAALRHGG